MADRAVDVSGQVATRLLRPRASLDIPDAESPVGGALLAGQLDRVFPGQGWDVAARDQLAAATRVIQDAGITNPALIGGLAGLAYAARSLSRGGTRYQRLISGLDDRIVAIADRIGRRLASAPAGSPSHVFDAVNGLAGTTAYLLCRDEPPHGALTGLVAFCGADNWFTPYEQLGPALARDFPCGVYNCGMSHGVVGPLAALSLAYAQGFSVAGQAGAIRRVAYWLAERRQHDDWGPVWPMGFDSDGGNGPRGTQDAWCYGGPGVARALWLAGEAIADDELRSLATQTLAGVVRRPWPARALGDSPGLCHGVAGLLQITMRFAHDTGDPRFFDFSRELTETLLAMYEPERPFGYRRKEVRGVRLDDPGLLDGAAGVALALLSAGNAAEPAWDRMLLLS